MVALPEPRPAPDIRTIALPTTQQLPDLITLARATGWHVAQVTRRTHDVLVLLIR